jgi:glutathione S-transferase
MRRLLEQGDQDKPDYRALQPFGQVPIMEEDGHALFESGAIVLHLGARSDALLPTDPRQRDRAMQWVFAALNSVEPALVNLFLVDVVFAKEDWARLRRQSAFDLARRRLAGLSNSLGDKSYLDGERFTAGDLMMATVLRIPAYSDLVTGDRRLNAYLERCTGRPAFARALEAQFADFKMAA